MGNRVSRLRYERMSGACEPVRQIVSASLDGEASVIERKRAERHLAGCPDCRRFAAAAGSATRTVREAPLAHPATTLVPAPAARRRGARARRGGAVAAAAASLAAAAALGALVSAQTADAPAVQTEATVLQLAEMDTARRQHLIMRRDTVPEGLHPIDVPQGERYRMSRLEYVTLG
jgi:anti-sigma factor RsiW